MKAVKPKPNPQENEILPDAWSRFERAVDVVAKSPPHHRSSAKPKPRNGPTKREAAKK